VRQGVMGSRLLHRTSLAPDDAVPSDAVMNMRLSFMTLVLSHLTTVIAIVSLSFLGLFS